jgi:hypothetical protein
MKALIQNVGRVSVLLFLMVLVASPVFAQGGGGGGRGGGAGRGGGQGGQGGREAAPPPRPAPRDANGRAILGGENPKDKGLWLPVFGITDPILAAAKVPFQPWAKAVSTWTGVRTLET